MIPHHYGLTGSRSGVSTPQLNWLNYVMRGIGMTGFHHGACWGADHAGHLVALQYYRDETNQPITVHPPTDRRFVAKECLQESRLVRVRPAKPYLLRNRDIVDETVLLFALPDGPERLRSGTWSTVRYARRLERPVLICMPDGQVIAERCEPYGPQAA